MELLGIASLALDRSMELGVESEYILSSFRIRLCVGTISVTRIVLQTEKRQWIVT